MILAIDAHYADDCSVIAGALFETWRDADAAQTHAIVSGVPTPYQPGEFYKRELPLILNFLSQLKCAPSHILIDGYVTLDEHGRKGLGAHLYAALDQSVPVIGVAKTAFNGSPHAKSVLRGKSQMPLYVTAAGIDQSEAAKRIAEMHGPFRIPALLKCVDQLARETLESKLERTAKHDM